MSKPSSFVPIFLVIFTVLVETSPLEKNSTKQIIFPDDVQFVPKCENDQIFCEEVDIYPANQFYKILKNSPYEEEYFRKVTEEHHQMSDRFNPDEEFYLCSSKKRIQYPRVARNANNEWKFVYNFDRFVQWITTEECMTTECVSDQNVPNQIKTKCLQRFSDILLLVADKDGKPEWDLFLFPSACVCAYEPLINFNVT